MGNDYVVLLGPCAERVPEEVDGKYSWDAGDPIIQEGIYQLLPGLERADCVSSSRIPNNEIDPVVRQARYLIQTGTPSWMNYRYRLWWEAAARAGKKIAFLGIGLAVPYNGDFWFGREDFIRAKDAGIIDFIVCRDPLCYYWLLHRCGIPQQKISLLPCPGFYVLPPRQRTEKKKVVFAVANPEEVSCGTHTTFKDYFEKAEYIVTELEKRGAEVFLAYHRHLPSFPDFVKTCGKFFPNKKLHWFPLFEDFKEFHRDKDVYIGIRNHGALPCAGSGMPSLLLGTDYRQHIADTIPFLSRFDISYIGIDPCAVIDWYYALRVKDISDSLSAWRGVTHDHWQDVLEKISVEL